jgi:hypothetical protein
LFDPHEKVVFGGENGGGVGGVDSQKAYAESLSRAAAAAGFRFRVEFESHSECAFFHRPPLKAKSGRSYKTLRKLLLGEHPKEAVVGSGVVARMSQEDLVRKVRSLTPDDDYFGYVVVLGGRESREENFPAESMFGFCHQRRPVRADEIGAYTEERVLRKCEGDELEASLFLERKAQIPQTMTARSFHGGGETLSLAYFKFLLDERDFCDFTIAHFVMYRRKDFLRPFLEKNLQERHDLQKVEDSLLARNTKKLILNSFFGFSAMMESSFPVTAVVNEKTLQKKRLAGKSNRANEICLTLLGATHGNSRRPQLLYAMTTENKKAKIKNVNSIAACILGMSKVVFFSKLLVLLRCLDPTLAELCYMDTVRNRL